jgi:hypothetical protein
VASFGRGSVASGKASLNIDQLEGIIVPAIALIVAGRQRNDTPVTTHSPVTFHEFARFYPWERQIGRLED